jgi:menaquinone-dependent protoporphyrinogen oxidase
MAIADRLHERGAETEVLDVRFGHLPAPDGFEAVVIGSRVEIGRHANAVLDYVRDYREVLERMPTAFFSVSMAASNEGAGPDPSGYLTDMFAKLDWKPSCSVALAGGLPYRKYGWVTRWIMKRISKSAGHSTDTTRNHEATDWKKVREFADEIFTLLPNHVMAHQML